MNSWAVFFIGAVLLSPAWAQEPAANTPAPAPRTFDLSNDSIKKIVYATAATQFATVQLSEAAPAEREAEAVFVFEPPEPKAPPIKRVTKPRAAAPQSSDFISSAFEILFDELLGVDRTAALDEDHNKTLGCNEHPDLQSSTPMLLSCPGRYPMQNASMAEPIRP